MRPRSAALALAPASVLLSAACLDPTQATVRIRTDAPCATAAREPGSLVGSGIAAGPPRALAERDAPNTTTTSCADGDVGSIVIFPSDGANEAGVVVVGLLGSSDQQASVEDCMRFASGAATEPAIAATCIVARRRIAFVDHTMLELPITLYGACAGIRCDADSTCVPGAPPDAAGNPCVSSTVTCQADGTCPDAATAASSSASASSTSGNGGAGGAGGDGGGGGGGSATLELLPNAPGAMDGEAYGVSEDGLVVAGASPAQGSPLPVVWRNNVAEQLDLGGFGMVGYVNEVCGTGDHVVGSIASGTFLVTRWSWNGSAWQTAPAAISGEGRDCDATGDLVLASSGGTVLLIDGTTLQMGAGDAGTGGAISADGSRVVGTSGALAAAWDAAYPPALALLYEEPSATMAWGVNGDGTIAVAESPTGPRKLDLLSLTATPMAGAPTDVPRAVSTANGFLAVGVCGQPMPQACVWDDTNVYSLAGTSPPPWPGFTGSLPAGVDHLRTALDISADGRVIVGTAIMNDGARRAFKLTSP